MQLVIKDLCSWYGQAQVLYDLNIHVDQGEVVGVLGRNGAGKTTLLRSIAGLQSRVTGDVIFDGTSILGHSAHSIALRGLTLVREGGRMANSLTVRQGLILGQRLARGRKVTARSLEEIWQLFPLLEPLRDRRAGLLSGGQRQALALAIAFIAQPRLLLLDEPSAGLSPPVARDMFRTIARLASDGMPILVVEQHPAWLVGIAKRGYFLEVGKIANEGPIQGPAKDEETSTIASVT